MAKVIRRSAKKTAAPKTSRPSNSIVIETKYEEVKSLNPYYRNPRVGDVEKVAESLGENGQFKPIVVNTGEKTGRPREILGGNHTWLASRKLGWKEIFVAWVNVDEVEAKKIVLADNGTSDGSTYDDSILTELLAGIKDAGASLIGTTYTDDTLNSLIKTSEKSTNSDVDKIEDASDVMDGVQDLNDFVHFESHLPYDIPPLLPEMIPDELPGPVDVWAGHEIDLDRQEENPDQWWLTQWHAGNRLVNWHQSIAYFYTEDFHFESVYTDPRKNTKKILNLGMRYAIMPNYSVNPDDPIAKWIWASYRSFFVGRYFQEAGIKVIPDIQYGTADEALDITLLGIPENAGVVATQLQNARGDQTRIRTTARLLKESEDRLGFQNIIVYGHTDADRILERAKLEANIIRVANRSARRRKLFEMEGTINSQKVTSGRRRKKSASGD
ncbi:DUF4417 domain-containing protein [Streptomyces sp. NPDC006477]|uniref:DUF4417 domain-containing protein n=1 Tax=Streptomyces sp. NPDC006477 TaxID=3364747 RepID=UPI0036B9AC7C